MIAGSPLIAKGTTVEMVSPGLMRTASPMPSQSWHSNPPLGMVPLGGGRSRMSRWYSGLKFVAMLSVLVTVIATLA
jgi:hypothetical protein